MVIDYRAAWLADAAVRTLGEAGIAATSARVRVAVSDDPSATQWIVHRVTVPEPDAGRARATLREHGLLDPWWIGGIADNAEGA